MKQDFDSKILDLKVEKLRMSREETVHIFDKGLMTYFLFLLVAFIGRVLGYVSVMQFAAIVIAGFLLLVITSFPYIRAMFYEKKSLDLMINELEKMRDG